MRNALGKAVRFCICGVLVTLVHVLVAVFLIERSQMGPPAANCLAFIVANILSYVINTKWSFSSKLHWGGFTRFLTVSTIGLTLSYSIAAIFQKVGLSYWSGIFFIVILVPVVTFMLHSLWTYKKCIVIPNAKKPV